MSDISKVQGVQAHTAQLPAEFRYMGNHPPFKAAATAKTPVVDVFKLFDASATFDHYLPPSGQSAAVEHAKPKPKSMLEAHTGDKAKP